MARAISVHHGAFGRATLYELDKPLITHAHREGHLIFYLGGARPQLRVGDSDFKLDKDNAVAISTSVVVVSLMRSDSLPATRTEAIPSNPLNNATN